MEFLIPYRCHLQAAVIILLSIIARGSLAHEQPVDVIAADPKPQLILGVAPFMSPLALVKRMAPLREYLSESLGYNIVIETTRDSSEYLKRVLAGRYDFILSSPTFTLNALDHNQYRVLATQVRPLSGHIIVLDDSPIKSISELAGKKIGAPPKNGFLGQLLKPYLYQLNMHGESAPVVKFFHNHNDAISALRVKEIDASFVANFMKQHLQKKSIHFRTLAHTADFPGLTVSAAKRMPNDLSKKINQLLLGLSGTQDGRVLLKKINFLGFRDITAEELEGVRPYVMMSEVFR